MDRRRDCCLRPVGGADDLVADMTPALTRAEQPEAAAVAGRLREQGWR
jgi:hypothetical protein